MSQPIYSVSTLVHYIKETLDEDMNLQSVLIKGEISNFTNHRSGHWYFTLKDNKSKLSCVMFASYASRSKILLKEGMKVIVNASLSIYETSGSMQLYVTQVQIDGLGDLFLQLEQVKQKLSAEGLFDPTHKKPLPQYPLNIGIITAKTGAAIQDILTTIARRWPIANVSVYPCLVQGTLASAAIIKNLEAADAQGHDVILLARGGGAIEDLWCFNDEQLARCIYSLKSVIVSGVGHESDTTLVDYVSDARAPTPTAAAELITPDIQEVLLNVVSYKQRLMKAMEQHVTDANHQLTLIKEHRYIKRPLSYIEQAQNELALHTKELSIVEHMQKDLQQHLQSMSHQLGILAQRNKNEKNNELAQLTFKMKASMEQYQTKSLHRMKQNVALLDAYSPLKILSRGYQITYKDQHIVKRVKDVCVDDELTLRFADGNLITKVEKKENL
ncbi:MAG: exodeoxyribonuclease VII large subunit [Longicatena sp.]